jgi:SAM-dependent methyltransferase
MTKKKELLLQFIEECRTFEAPRVLEIGTKRSQAARSTRHNAWVPHASEYVGLDYQSGLDVDVVADAHHLVSAVGEKSFDVVISCSTFEHLKYPWLVAHQIMQALRPGGLLFVQTHQTFPIHAFPNDYYRFTREAMASLFNTSMGMQVETEYNFPAQIHSERTPTSQNHKSFLNVVLFGRKVANTPSSLVYEFENLG